MSEYFYERCGVAILDLGYPSNFETFSPLISNLPGIIFKKPNTIHKMFHHDDIHGDMDNFKLHDLAEWGTVFDFDQISKF
jgi:hypothetical protein